MKRSRLTEDQIIGTQECLALIPDTPLSGARVTWELATLFEARGKTATVVSDNGT